MSFEYHHWQKGPPLSAHKRNELLTNPYCWGRTNRPGCSRVRRQWGLGKLSPRNAVLSSRPDKSKSRRLGCKFHHFCIDRTPYTSGRKYRTDIALGTGKWDTGYFFWTRLIPFRQETSRIMFPPQKGTKKPPFSIELSVGCSSSSRNLHIRCLLCCLGSRASSGTVRWRGHT